ncbi:hypothetical protein C8F04DRAFT_708587 [Mycena alexandri]|uniref:Protein kinase domain-containing protein n=1 Tax=Mycena alexandri TaxID=1745969 RepID=A0AAD6SRF0_9AGAR|nr:hypothetical protein C8F04DRAFT_708587 [Mycena alexandri]
MRLPCFQFRFFHRDMQLHRLHGFSLLSLAVELDEREVVRQIFHGLSFLHQHGVVHRDLHLGNIAIEFPFLRTSGVNEIMKASRHPICHPCVLGTAVPHPPSLPAYLVERAKFCERLAPLMREEASLIVVKLLDFGCAFRPGTDDILSAQQGGPASFLKAPECVLAGLLPDPTIAPLTNQDSANSHELTTGEMPPKKRGTWPAPPGDLRWRAMCHSYSRMPTVITNGCSCRRVRSPGLR